MSGQPRVSTSEGGGWKNPNGGRAAFVLGVTGKSGSGFDTECAAVLATRGFVLVRAADEADRAWAVAAMRRRMAAEFPQAFDPDPCHTSGWTRRRGVMGTIMAADEERHVRMRAILRPYLVALVAERVQEAVAASCRRVAVIAETMVVDGLYSLCHAVWFVDRPEHECREELERRYRRRAELDPAYVTAKVRKIMRWNRDVVMPGGLFLHDAVIEYDGDASVLERRIMVALVGTGALASNQPRKSRPPSGATHSPQTGRDTLLLNATGQHGQFVRSALGLAQLTCRGIRLTNVAGLERPGRRRDVIITCARACARLFGGKLGIDEQRRVIDYEPGAEFQSPFEWEVPPNTPLGNIIQTVLPALVCGNGRVVLSLRGATELNHSSPMLYYARVLFPLLARMGPRFKMEVLRHGFFGGSPGEARLTVDRVPRLRPLVIPNRGTPETLTLWMTLTPFFADKTRDFPAHFESFCRERGFAGEFRLERIVVGQDEPGFAISATLEAGHSVLGTDVAADSAHERSPRGLSDALSRLQRRTLALLESPAGIDSMCADKLLAYMSAAGGRVTAPIFEHVEHLYAQVGLLNRFQERAVRVTLRGDGVQLDCASLTKLQVRTLRR